MDVTGSRLAQTVRCDRCGAAYQAFSRLEARARQCPACAARARAFAEAAAAMLLAAVVVSALLVTVVLWR